jgi:hypothetical protein
VEFPPLLFSPYLANHRDVLSYTKLDEWVYTVDSAYALDLLRIGVPFGVYLRALKVANRDGPAHEPPSGSAIEGGEGYEVVSLGAGVVECVERTEAKAGEYIESKPIDMTQRTSFRYGHPGHPTHPIDAVMCDPATQTVWYLQGTVGTALTVDLPEVQSVHKLVVAALLKSSSSSLSGSAGWAFKYVAIAP